MAASPQIDIKVHNEGTIWLFEPVTPAAKELFEYGIKAEGWQRLGGDLAVDHRPALHLALRLQSEGWVLG